MRSRIARAILCGFVPFFVGCSGGASSDTSSNGSSTVGITAGPSSSTGSGATGSGSTGSGGSSAGTASSSGGSGSTGAGVPAIVATIEGTLAADLATSVTTHDEIVSQTQASTQDAGDYGHHVYVASGAEDAGTPQWLAVDDWTSLAGAQATYSSPQFGEAFSSFFSAPPTVTLWTLAPGFTSYALPIPAGTTMLRTVVVQGLLGFPVDQAQAAHNGIVAQIGGAAQDAGDLYHQAYLSTQADGGVFLLNFDVWGTDAVFQFYNNPVLAAGFAAVFADGGPSVAIYDSLPASWTQWGTSPLP